MRILFLLAMSWVMAVTLSVSAAGEPESRKSADRGVTVTVTPQDLTTAAKTWDFKIVLDTHSGDLSDDLMKSSVLVDGAGVQYAPVAWEGAGPGGHHREGVLRFKALTRITAVELRITRTGESAPRSFRWELN